MESKKITKEEFTKEISNFKEIKNLHYFLLNVSNLIWCNGYLYCFCDKFDAPSLNSQKENVLFAGYYFFFLVLNKNWT